MPPAKKAPAKTQTAHARCAENERLTRRISDSLDVAQVDLGKLRGSIGSGVGDLRRDLSRLLRDARRDTRRLGSTTRKDLERLQKDVAVAATPASARAKASRAKATRAKPARKASRAKTAAR